MADEEVTSLACCALLAVEEFVAALLLFALFEADAVSVVAEAVLAEAF